MFGVLSPAPDVPTYDIVNVACTCFCLAVGVVNVLSLTEGAAEKPGAKIAREDLNMVTYGGMVIAYLVASQKGAFPGTYAMFWNALFFVEFLVHLKLVLGNFTGIRKTMGDNLFKGDVEALDLVNSACFILYGPMMFLAVGLRIDFLRGPMVSLMTLFGILEPAPQAFDYSNPAWFGGSAALGMAALSLAAFSGAAEDKDYAEIRRFASAVFWAGSIVSMSAFPESGSFYSVWITISLAFALLVTKKVSEEAAKAKTDYRQLP